MSNYIDISKQQRVVFVDNIQYDNAKALSKQYPFAMFFTSADDNVYHTIWRNGFCYSYVSEIDSTPVIVNDKAISLSIDRKGKLSLIVGYAIGQFVLSKYENSENNFVNYEEDHYIENYNTQEKFFSEEITLKDTGELFFDLYDNYGDPLAEYNKTNIALLEFRLYRLESEEDLTNSYITNLRSEKDANNQYGIKYTFEIKRQYLDDDLRLEVSYNSFKKIYPITLQKSIVEELIWIGSGNPNFGDYYSQEVTENDIVSFDMIGWHYLKDLALNDSMPNIYDYYSVHHLNVQDGNIYVVIPINKRLRVKLIEDNSTEYVVDDEGPDYSYSYDSSSAQICLINGARYKILRLNDPNITEFINIIQ